MSFEDGTTPFAAVAGDGVTAQFGGIEMAGRTITGEADAELLVLGAGALRALFDNS